MIDALASARAENRRLTTVVNLLKRVGLGPVVLQTGGTVRGENPRRSQVGTSYTYALVMLIPDNPLTVDRQA